MPSKILPIEHETKLPIKCKACGEFTQRRWSRDNDQYTIECLGCGNIKNIDFALAWERITRAMLFDDACECEKPTVKEGSVLCQACLGNLPLKPG